MGAPIMSLSELLSLIRKAYETALVKCVESGAFAH